MLAGLYYNLNKNKRCHCSRKNVATKDIDNYNANIIFEILADMKQRLTQEERILYGDHNKNK